MTKPYTGPVPLDANDIIGAHRTMTQQAQDQLAMAAGEAAALRRMVGASFAALDACILSGQVPEERVPEIVADVPGFAQWRAAKAG